MGCAIGLAVVPTVYPYYLHKKTLNLKHMELAQTPTTQAVVSSNVQSILDTISKLDTFNLFMKHLVKEFNTENLLFLVELAQIKHAFKSNHPNIDKSSSSEQEEENGAKDEISAYLVNNNKYSKHYKEKLVISAAIPQSMILSKADTLHGRMTLLYDKYIKIGGDLQLNLSNKTMKPFIMLFGENDSSKNDEDLYGCFDNAALEILGVLRDPFQRFMASESPEPSVMTEESNSK